MSEPDEKRERGTVYTFYSFKGGVGRTMALANVAALLAKWGHSVLVVDWDLEAPGVERFFARANPGILDLRASKPGIVDLVKAIGNGQSLPWRDCLIDVRVGENHSRLSFISAGRGGDDYVARMQGLDFRELFDKHDLGAYIEELRNEWIGQFDFVLIDSRTGVTDIGGICTVHLADVLVLLFTTTDSSTDGARQILERARNAQERLPLDRRRLVALPVPARDESRTEYEKASEWKRKFADQFKDVYSDWLPTGTSTHDAIDVLRIPYVPYWSFGESLPAIEEGTTDPASLGHAYEILARLVAARLDWYAALKGQSPAPPPASRKRSVDGEWLARHRLAASEGLVTAGKQGFMELYHFCVDASTERSQSELLAAARQAEVKTFGWPIGLVMDREEYRPRPLNEGIRAEINTAKSYDYWSLTRSGDFYTLMSLFEDERSKAVIFFNTRIVRATEALVHCNKLYKALGVEPGSQVQLTTRYGGIRGRTLTATSNRIPWPEEKKNPFENETSSIVTFRLATLEDEIVDLVKRLCEPLFVLFDFESFDDKIYQDLVTDFLKGKVT